MSQYELTFLLNEEQDQKKVEDIFKSSPAKLLQQETWGKRILSYPVKKKASAYYFCWKFEIDQSKLQELKTKLKFNESILRSLLLKLDK